MRRSSSIARHLGRIVAGLALAVAALAAAAPALGAGISLDRVPTPPQAVRSGTGVEVVSLAISYATTADRYELKITDPTGAVPFSTTVPIGDTTAAQRSPITASVPWTPGAGAVAGRYTISLAFFSREVGPTTPESTATAVFDVASELGNLRLEKWEDLNGNGRRDPNEPGVPSWAFTLVNPQGNPGSAVTGADGSVTLAGVPAGTWNVAEVLQPGWLASTAPTGTVIVPPNGIGTFSVGNLRPAPISGTVFIDTNRSGGIDAGEVGRSGVTVTLTGVDGKGATLSTTTTSATDGGFSFAGLLPGVYTVTGTVPPGLEATTPTRIPNIAITSNVPSPNHDIGLIDKPPAAATPPPVVPVGRPTGQPTPGGIAITKTGPAVARRGVVINYRIRVRSTGPGPAVNVVVTDPVPPNMSLVSVPERATLVNGVVTWRLGTMRAGTERTLTLRTRLDRNARPGRYRNTATVTANGLPPERDTTVLRVPSPPRPGRSGGVTG